MSGHLFAARRGTCAERFRIFLIGVIGLSICVTVASAAQEGRRLPRPRRVVVLFAEAAPTPTTTAILDALNRDLRSRYRDLEMHTQFLDSARTLDPQRGLANWLVQRFSNRPIDVVVPVGVPASSFAARQNLWRSVPVVFAGVDTEWLSSTKRPRLTTAVTSHPNDLRTVEAALAVFPHTSRVVLLAGASAADRRRARAARAALLPLAGRLQVVDLGDRRYDDVARGLGELPDGSIILALSFLADADGRPFDSQGALIDLARRANRPVFTTDETLVTADIIGGDVSRSNEIGRRTGAIVGRVLAGEDVSTIPVADVGDHALVFDARALAHWGVNDARLPSGSFVQGRQPRSDAWPAWVATAVTAALALLTLAVAVLLVKAHRRNKLQAALDERLEFKRRLDDVSAASAVASAPTDSAAGLRLALSDIAVSLGAERVLVFERADARTGLTLWCSSDAPGIAPDEGLADGACPAVNAPALDGRVVRLDSSSTDLDAGSRDWRALQARGLHGLLATPLRAAGETIGVLTLLTQRAEARWSDEQARRAELLASVLSHALMHVRDGREARDSAAFSLAVLSSVGADVAVVDAQGVVLAANASWREAAARGNNPGIRAIPGAAFFDGLNETMFEARFRLTAAVQCVLRGEREQAGVDYSWEDGSGRRWSELRVQTLNRKGGGAVVAHTDITTRKRAEAEVHTHLHELAHVNMMSGMGELAASVAHELNQPLTAVLSNAQAARRMLMAPQPRIADVQEILDDIIDQDKRAGDVIQRIRRLLRKEPFEWAPLDVNALIRDVVRLLANQATLGGVAVISDLAAELPAVRGDRVQLQQVVVNLVLNAIQASRTNSTVRAAQVSVVTRTEGDALLLAVRDSGPGIDARMAERIFEPFFTTKPDGLGIGLSISRSIVELHRGRLSAATLGSGGAEFLVTLPLEEGMA